MAMIASFEVNCLDINKILTITTIKVTTKD